MRVFNEKVLLFSLEEPVVTEKRVQVIIPEKPIDEDVESPDDENDSDEEQEEIVISESIKILPPSWQNSYGVSIESIAAISFLEQHHYAGEWDVLSPAKEIEELNTLTSSQLEELLHEAESIMEGWNKPDAYRNESGNEQRRTDISN